MLDQLDLFKKPLIAVQAMDYKEVINHQKPAFDFSGMRSLNADKTEWLHESGLIIKEYTSKYKQKQGGGGYAMHWTFIIESSDFAVKFEYDHWPTFTKPAYDALPVFRSYGLLDWQPAPLLHLKRLG